MVLFDMMEKSLHITIKKIKKLPHIFGSTSITETNIQNYQTKLSNKIKIKATS